MIFFALSRTIVPLWRSICVRSTAELFRTLHSDVFFVAYKLSAPEHAYTQRFLARITVRNGQIANYHELWDLGVAGDPSATASHN